MDVYLVMAGQLARQHWYGHDRHKGDPYWATARAKGPIPRIAVALLLIGIFAGGLSVAGCCIDGFAPAAGTLHAGLPAAERS